MDPFDWLTGLIGYSSHDVTVTLVVASECCWSCEIEVIRADVVRAAEKRFFVKVGSGSSASSALEEALEKMDAILFPRYDATYDG